MLNIVFPALCCPCSFCISRGFDNRICFSWFKPKGLLKGQGARRTVKTAREAGTGRASRNNQPPSHTEGPAPGCTSPGLGSCQVRMLLPWLPPPEVGWLCQQPMPTTRCPVPCLHISQFRIKASYRSTQLVDSKSHLGAPAGFTCLHWKGDTYNLEI